MAKQGEHKTLWKWGLSNVCLLLYWKTISVDKVNNHSEISWEMYLGFGGGLIATNKRNYTVVIDGKTYTGTVDVHTNNSDLKLLTSGTTIIPHDAYGKKTFSYSYELQWDILGDSTPTRGGSSTGVLDDIPIVPVSVITAPNFTDEENPTITYGNGGVMVGTIEAGISLTHAEDDIAYREVDKSTNSYTFNLTEDERKILRKAVTTGNTIQVHFYIRSTIHGLRYWEHLTKTFTLVNYMPTVNPVVKDTNAKTKALTGDESVLIPGYSNAYFDVGASPKKEATVQSQSATCGAIVKTTATGTFEAVPSNAFTFYCRDSRGYMVYQTYTAETVGYFKPTCNQSVKLNMDGTMDLSITGKCFTGSFGAKNNTLKVEHRFREAGNEWGAWEDITVTLGDMRNGTYTLTTEKSGFDPSGTYEFQARVTDALTSAESAIDSITLEPIFDWSRNDFNFNVPVSIQGDTINDFVVATGTEAMYPTNPANGTWYWRKWKSGRAECYGRRNFGAMAVTTAWGNLYRSEYLTQDFPSGLFTAVPEVIDITYSFGSSGGWIVRHENTMPTNSQSGSFIMVRPASATISSSFIGFNVIGRWK